MSHPLVTIIIPVYNNEQFVSKCVESVMRQTYQNLQIVIIDDGSTDSSLAICKQINDERVEVYLKMNGGASSARNYGLQYIKGEYVLFVDSDDYLISDAVEKLVSIAVKTNADCVYYEAENTTEDDTIKIKKNGLRQSVDYPVSDGSTLINALLEQHNYHAVPFLYFTKASLFNNGLSFEEGIMFEDELYSFKLLRSCQKVVCLREVLYIRNVHSNSVMTSAGKEVFRFHSISVVFNRLFDEYEENRNDKVYNRYIARIAMLLVDYYYQMNNSNNQIKQQYAEIKKQILENRGFGNKELVIRSHSNLLWYMYIVPNRIRNNYLRKLNHG